MDKQTRIMSGICVFLATATVAVGIISTMTLCKVNAISNKMADHEEGNYHTIYDDTAVVAAYKSGNAAGLSEDDKFVLDTANGIIKGIITDGMTDYDKEKAVYDWLIEYVAFDDENFSPIRETDDNFTPYGVLKNHDAICVGNATTFKLFMDMLGIDCKIIHSTESGEHAWNMVKINGEWYHCDLTFDGGENGVPSYNNFNVPDAVAHKNGYSYDVTQYPAATAVEDCYAYKNSVELTDIFTLPTIIKKAADNNVSVMYIRYSRELAPRVSDDSTVVSNAVQYISDNYFTDGNESEQSSENRVTSVGITEMWLGKEYVGVIRLERAGKEEPGTQDTIDYDKLGDAANHAFGR